MSKLLGSIPFSWLSLVFYPKGSLTRHDEILKIRNVPYRQACSLSSGDKYKIIYYEKCVAHNKNRFLTIRNIFTVMGDLFLAFQILISLQQNI